MTGEYASAWLFLGLVALYLVVVLVRREVEHPGPFPHYWRELLPIVGMAAVVTMLLIAGLVLTFTAGAGLVR